MKRIHTTGRLPEFLKFEPDLPRVYLLNRAFAPQPNIALQLTPTASLLVPYATLRRR